MFKSGNNNWFTKGMFFETTLANKSTVLYTLKDVDHLGFPSLSRLYIETGDITEYRFANTHLGGWDHWLTLQQLDWMQPYIAKWRAELQVKLQSDTLAIVKEIAVAKGREALSAAKCLLEAVGSPYKRFAPGRPHKDHSEDKIAQQALDARLLAEDVFRMQKDLN